MMKLSRLLGATALASSAFFISGVAFAQSASPQSATAPTTTAQTDPASNDEPTTTGETIVVTGSRIARPETSGVLPGVQVGAQQIETRGFTNALEALTDLPLTGAGASPLNGNNGGQTASLGAAFVDLLDLGTARTLTLVNGRRFVTGNAASLFVSGNETGSQVDVNVIPTSLVDRIDVVTVGGAAAYGADAVAGVVNYILIDDFDGIRARAVSGISERGDAAQYQLSVLAGKNFLDDRLNITLSAEYSRNEGLQATARDFRNIRPGTYTNPFNGGIRNPAFTGRDGFTDVTNLNNGAFKRATDDGQPSTLFGLGIVTQTLSNPGTILNVASNTFLTPYTPITSGTGATLRTTNYISFANGISPVGFALVGRNAAGARTTVATPNNGFYNVAGTIISGIPGVGLAFNDGTAIGNLSGNGLNGRTTQATNVPFTTFAPTALPGNVTAAQVFAAYGVTPPAQTASQTAAAYTTALNLLAVNLLQANRFTAREFLAANPTVNLDYFVGTFAPQVPRVANTDTTPVLVKVNGTNVSVPVNQVLPYRAVPLEFNDDGSIRVFNYSGPVSGNDPINIGATRGGNGGFRRSLENTVLRTQQDRYVFNGNAALKITDNIKFFTENTYVKIRNVSLGNISGAQSFLTSTQENPALLLNYNNPYLDAQDRAALTSVGITPTAANGGNFLLTRQNQDLFGANPYIQRGETYRFLGGVSADFSFLGQAWNAEFSGSYGRTKQVTDSFGVADNEFQLALDAVDQGLATTGVANGNIVCRAQLFPAQYLGRTPTGTAENITRVKGADGLPTEVLYTPTITQEMINNCRPLNPFGYDQMSQAAKNYVVSPSIFTSVAEQTNFAGSLGGGLFDLPAGTLAFNANGEYRRDKAFYTSNELNTLGRSRSAPSSTTSAYTETVEFGGELSVPLTGGDFLGFLGAIELNPGIRVSKQSGEAASYRNLAGQVITPKASGDWNTIYTLAGSWQPIRDIRFRGNYTKSVRQPSIVELFLGGQPVFTTPTDYCSTANIDQGVNKANRRANCQAAVVAAGLAPNTAAAATYLQSFVPQGTGLQGTYSGAPGLLPERGTSWTVGTIITPRWVPGLRLGADYISLRLDDTIVPVGLNDVLRTCYDSPTYPDPSPQIGVNTCSQFSRDANFQINNGYQAGFLNLGAIRIKALNFSGEYRTKVGSDSLTLTGDAYYLIKREDSSAGDFSDTVASAGTFGRPSLTTRASVRYEHDNVFGQLTWRRQSPTRIFVSGVPATIENYPYSRYPSINNLDFALGSDITENFRIQLTATNLLDQTTAGDLGYRFADYWDQIGRRYKIQVSTKF